MQRRPGRGRARRRARHTLSDWADRTHAQGGTVVVAHFPNPNGEPAVLVATGRADAVEMLAQGPTTGSLEYYRYLNAGYRLPLVGGTDKMSNDVPVGLYRTYATWPDDEEFTYEGWCRAVARAGRSCPAARCLDFTVDGRRLGDTVELSGPGTVTVEARSRSIFPLRIARAGVQRRGRRRRRGRPRRATRSR